MSRVNAFVIALIVALCVGSAGAAEEKIPVYVDAQTPDRLGTTYVYQLREQLRGSQTYAVVLKRGDARFVISLVSLDPGTNEGVTIVSVVLLAHILIPQGPIDCFVNQWIVSTSRDQIDGGVRDLVASIDQDVQQLLAPTK